MRGLTGSIALVGGDEFRPGCEPMDRALLEATGADCPRVVILPTAAAHENPGKAAANGVSYFSGLGCDASALMVVDSAGADDEALVGRVDGADLVYLTGGSPRLLLEVLSGSLLLLRLLAALRRGAVVAGSSAGAMVLGSYMCMGGWTPALGVVEGVAVLPHHEGRDPATVSEGLGGNAPAGLLVLGIDAMAGALSGPDGWSVVGDGKVTAYRDGSYETYEAGDALPVGGCAGSGVGGDGRIRTAE